MHKKTQYHHHWLNFLALHGLLGIATGLLATLLLDFPFPSSPLLGLGLGIALAWYRAMVAPGDLTDWQIQLVAHTIQPYCADQVEPDSYDLKLGDTFTEILPDGSKKTWTAPEITLQPHQCVLAHTLETFSFPNNLKGHLHGKSSWARLSLFVECAGLFDKGFQGTAVLELYNASPRPVCLKAGSLIAQMSFHRTLSCSVPYGNKYRTNHYQNQTGAQTSWINPK